MPEVVKITPSFDFEHVASFQKRCFGNDWISPERERLQCPAYYKWKYFTPAGAAWLASVRSKGELLAMTAAVPFWMVAGGHQLRTWQICDIATHPDFRDQGLFSKCLGALRETLAGELLFCFPNERSRRRLVKAGFSIQTKLQLRARPVFFLRKREPQIELDLSGLPADLISDNEPQLHVVRSAEFLRWRYSSHPVIKYTAIVTPRSNTVQTRAVIFVRIIDLFGLRFCLIMESWPSSEIGLRLTTNAALEWANKNQCCAVVSAGEQTTATLSLESFWSIRGWRLPKSITLYATTEPALVHQGVSSWALQPADWDAV